MLVKLLLTPVRFLIAQHRAVRRSHRASRSVIIVLIRMWERCNERHGGGSIGSAVDASRAEGSGGEDCPHQRLLRPASRRTRALSARGGILWRPAGGRAEQ